MGQFFEELKRRNVFRVAVAYAVVGWLLAEVGGLLFQTFEAPGWVMKVFATVIVLGFPLALFFAWAYELTPEGLKREHEVDRSESITHLTGRKLDFAIIGLLAIAVVFLVVDNYVLIGEPAPVVTEQTQPAIPPVEKSIAVLPFVNMSDDPGNEYFSDGLSEEILNLLAKIPGLKVIGRTSSFAFKGKNTDLRDIGQALDVKTVLEGSVRKSGDRVRITAQLVDVSDGAHIWSETYDRTMTDIFAIQDNVAAAIIDALKIHVGANPTRGRPTENTDAYALFLKAGALRNVSELLDAEEAVLKAIKLDPKFAEAYELLAFIYVGQSGNVVESAEGQKLMGEAAAKALAIDPDLVFAQALYQIGNLDTYSILGSIQGLERVVREAPNNTRAMSVFFFYLKLAGYLQEALGVAERHVDLEPLSRKGYSRLFEALYAVGRTSEAMAALGVGDQLEPDGTNWAWLIGDVNLVERRDEAAVARFEADLEQDGLPSTWVRELVTGGRDPATGQAYLDRRIPQIVASMPEEYVYDIQWRLTTWYLHLGFLDRYFELILATDLTGSTFTDAEIFVDEGTLYRRLGFTAHPKYLEVAESLGIIDVWEQRGPPDFCEKVGGQWLCE